MNVEIVDTREIPAADADRVETFLGTRVVAVQNGAEESKLRLEYGFEPSYGRTRRCLKVRRPGKSPIMTFYGGDRWGQNGRVYAKLPKSTGRGYIRDGSKIDPQLEELGTCRLRRFIEPRPGRRVEACWALAAQEDDLETLVQAALVCEQLRANS